MSCKISIPFFSKNSKKSTQTEPGKKTKQKNKCCSKTWAITILSIMYIVFMAGALYHTKDFLHNVPCCEKTNLILWIWGIEVLVITIAYFVFVYFINRMISICEEEMIRANLLEKYENNQNEKIEKLEALNDTANKTIKALNDELKGFKSSQQKELAGLTKAYNGFKEKQLQKIMDSLNSTPTATTTTSQQQNCNNNNDSNVKTTPNK